MRKKLDEKDCMNSSLESLSGSSSEEEDESPREVIQKNSSGSSDFCVRKIAQHSYGRREIEVIAICINVAYVNPRSFLQSGPGF